MSAAVPVIVAEDLTKQYGDRLAVDHLDLEVRRGEVFGLLGPNGAGKTTTVLMLLGLTEPTAGRVRVLGLDPARDPLAVKSRIGYLPDAVGFYGHLTGRQNLRYTTRLNHVASGEAEQRIQAALDQVGLAHAADRPAEQYSRGMLQRLGIADALVKNPEILILDEPTIAIDPRGVEELLTLIRRLRDEHGVTVLLSSHLLHQVQTVCDRVGIFVGGRLVACGTVDELGTRLSGGRQTIELVLEPPDAASSAPAVDRAEAIVRERLGDDAEVVREGDRLVVTTVGDPRAELVAALAAAGLPPVHVELRSSELDDIYVRWFAEHEPDPDAVADTSVHGGPLATAGR